MRVRAYMRYPEHLIFAGEKYWLTQSQWKKIAAIMADARQVLRKRRGEFVTRAICKFLALEGLLKD